MRCREGADSPSRDLRGLTSGVLLVLLFEDPEMEAWTDATTLACSGLTNLGNASLNQSINLCIELQFWGDGDSVTCRNLAHPIILDLKAEIVSTVY